MSGHSSHPDNSTRQSSLVLAGLICQPRFILVGHADINLKPLHLLNNLIYLHNLCTQPTLSPYMHSKWRLDCPLSPGCALIFPNILSYFILLLPSVWFPNSSCCGFLILLCPIALSKASSSFSLLTLCASFSASIVYTAKITPCALYSILKLPIMGTYPISGSSLLLTN